MSTLAAAQAGDEKAFAALVAGHRRELHAHCYRMLGSPQDAEDALQETLVAAWRGLAGFEQRSSLRAWLYRIATHACLRMGRRRPRVLSWEHAPARGPADDLGAPVTEPVFLEPLPGDPEEAYGRKESVELAYVAALQHLPPNQRAVLLLRDVLAFSAAEVAQTLDTSTASVTSALQRARTAVAERVPPRSQQAELASPEHRAAVAAFVAAWERMDLSALVALLTEDVRFTMPPLPAWFDGRDAVAALLADRIFATPWRFRPVVANAQPAMACYQGPGRFRLGAVNVLSLRDGRVSWIAAFLDPAVLARFGLPEEI